ncbi:Transcription factor IIIB 90 kDa subunit [Galdieria sulphuraria]|nr:Transcription factor IIIB 90 kDa subunit [Galdieria sulphuraria]
MTTSMDDAPNLASHEEAAISNTGRKCPHCGSTELEHDAAQGNTVCTQCGCIVEENTIVSEVTFVEGPGGHSSVVGQFVDSSGYVPSSGVIIPGLSKESREATRNNGRKIIAEVVGALHLNPSQEEQAFRMFLLAIEHNFLQGRKASNTNVYDLGRTFLKFARILNLSLPIIDPSLYIHRFASKLGFEEKTHAVATSALRLIARMKRDWIHTGRRPSGLCGAALFVAAKMHGFYRSQREIVNVVRIGDVTLRKRLLELEETPSALLTADEIDAMGGDDGNVEALSDINKFKESDPPSFKRRRNLEYYGEEDVIEREMNEALNSEEVKMIERGEQSAESMTHPIFAADFSSETFSRVTDEMTSGYLDDSVALNGSEVTNSNGHQSSKDEESLETDEDDDDLDLFDIDEEELNSYLNNEEEEQQKRELWTRLNQDYLERQAELAQDETEDSSFVEKKKRKTRRSSNRASHGTDSTVDAVLDALSEKKVSKKVNYAALQELFRFNKDNVSNLSHEEHNNGTTEQ